MKAQHLHCAVEFIGDMFETRTEITLKPASVNYGLVFTTIIVGNKHSARITWEPGGVMTFSNGNTGPYRAVNGGQTYKEPPCALECLTETDFKAVILPQILKHLSPA